MVCLSRESCLLCVRTSVDSILPVTRKSVLWVCLLLIYPITSLGAFAFGSFYGTQRVPFLLILRTFYQRFARICQLSYSWSWLSVVECSRTSTCVEVVIVVVCMVNLVFNKKIVIIKKNNETIFQLARLRSVALR